MDAPLVLLVRPPEQAQREAARWREAGWQAVPFPTLAVQADEAALAALPARFQTADAVFWVSPSTVGLAAPVMPYENAARLTHITVGQASKQALQPFAETVYCPQHGRDSEAVLQLDIWQRLPAGARILLVRGRGGRDFLAEQLRARGFAVEIAEVYFRRPVAPDWSMLETHRPQAVYVASSEAARSLFAQVPAALGQKLQSLLYFTHHERIAEALKQAGASRIRLIEPSDPAALRLLRRELL